MSEFAITLLCTVESMPAPVVMAVTAVSVGPPPFVIVSVAPWLTLWVYVVALDDVDVMLITLAEEVAVIRQVLQDIQEMVFQRRVSSA